MQSEEIKKAVEQAVEDERNRCVGLLEFYKHEFDRTALQALWCRIRNQIALGTQPDKADLRSQFEDDA